MALIKITGFTGEQPHIIPRLLPDTGAQSSYNVRLDDGGLTPIRKSVGAATIPEGNWQSIYRHEGHWLYSENQTDYAPGAVAQNRIYYTGDGPPKMMIGNDVYPLAVEYPPNPLGKSIDSDNAPEQPGDRPRDVYTRQYVYTFVTQFDEESEPCPVGDSIDWKAGQVVRLKGFWLPVNKNRGINRQRVYRTQTGSSGTQLYFIAERPVSDEDYLDNVPPSQFAEPLPSAGYNAPPDNLTGLISMPNGMMAAFAGQSLYFCEPYRPHAWPESYILQTDWPIVALAALNTTVIVMTEGQPYICQGTRPETMQMAKLPTNYPCINKRAVVDMSFSVIYPTYEGLIAIDAQGGCRLISANLYNRDGWLALNPSKMLGGQIGGRYIAFYDGVQDDDYGAIVIDPGQTPFLIRVKQKASCVFYDVNDSGLYFIPSDMPQAIYRLDDPTGDNENFYWRSKPFIMESPQNFGVVKIESPEDISDESNESNEANKAQAIAYNKAMIAAGTPILSEVNSHCFNETAFGGDILKIVPSVTPKFNIGVIADGKRRFQGHRTNSALRLPSGFLATQWEIEVEGPYPMTNILLATTMDDLKQSSG